MKVCDRCLALECRKILLKVERQFNERRRGRASIIARGEHWLCERCQKALVKTFALMVQEFIAEGRNPDLGLGQDPTPEKTSIFKRKGRPKKGLKV